MYDMSLEGMAQYDTAQEAAPIRDTIVTRLLGLARHLASAETEVHRARLDLDRAQQALWAARDRLLADPESPINGKNAEIREAQLRERTAAEREDLGVADAASQEACLRLRVLQHELTVLGHVATLLGAPR